MKGNYTYEETKKHGDKIVEKIYAENDLLNAPHSMFGKSFEKGDDLLKDLSDYNVTMVFYMALASMDRLVEKFSRYYPPDLPMAIVYHVGYSEKEKVLKSSLGKILDDLKKD